MLLTHENAKNEDFNLSTSNSTSVIDLADLIFEKINPGIKPNYKFVDPFLYDVQKEYLQPKKQKNYLILKQIPHYLKCWIL